MGGDTPLFGPRVVIGVTVYVWCRKWDRCVPWLSSTSCASRVPWVLGALALFLKGRSGPEVKRERPCTGRKTNRMQCGERALHPHLGVGGEAAREPWEESHERQHQVPGQISPSWTPARVPERFATEWLVTTLSAGFIGQLRKCAPSTSVAPITGFRILR